MPEKPNQQLHGSSLSPRIGESLEARTKDPLWFLARQWQTGEFEAENGGRPAFVSFSWKDHPLESLTVGGVKSPIQRDQPLELLVERESAEGEAPAWRTEALEYAFEAETRRHRFAAGEYHGRRLDWYHFDYEGSRTGKDTDLQTRRMTPTQLYFRGAPNPRWWRLEDSGASFDSPQDPEPNVLSMLLPEFFYTDINNWYVAPLPAPAGTLREMTEVSVVDSFGVVTEVSPIVGAGANEEWRLFATDLKEGTAGTRLDGRFLLMPNVALEILDNDSLEDVRFLRDEDANLVWAFEHRYLDADGTVVVNGDRPERLDEENEWEDDSGDAADPLPRFVLSSETEPHWVPYVPRYVAATSAVSGEVYLRRARSVEAATSTDPQYRSRIVAESWRLNEEEVPRAGTRIRRIARFARGSDGGAYFWVGRHKETGRAMTHPDLRFDYIE